MRVLVTGGAGFVGSVLVPMLLDRGDKVHVVDCGMFGTSHVDRRAELIRRDVLDFKHQWLTGIDAVVHLAGLSNDPMAAFSPSLNYLLNASGSVIVAHAAKEAGVRRFVFGSTCSVYGLSDAAAIDEDHDARPSFPYAISKLMAERGIGCLQDEQFRPLTLRKGTVVGGSPRMRFDLVANAMVKSALTERKIVVNNPDLWRPLIDVQDAARAYMSALDADLSISGTFNIAGQNYTIGELAEVVASTMTEFGIEANLEIHHRADVRSYRVSTGRAKAQLGFEASTPMAETVRGIVRCVRDQEITDFEHPRYYNVAQMKINVANEITPWSRIGTTNLTAPAVVPARAAQVAA